MKIGGILETALYCENLDAAEAFYGGLLGLTLEAKVDNRHVFYRCCESVFLIFNPHETIKPSTGSLPVPTHGTTGNGHICFRATNEEIDFWRGKLEGAGVGIEQDFKWPNGARSLYFRDPAGNSIEFAEPKLWDF